MDAAGTVTVDYICGDSTEAYNDVDHDGVVIQHKELGIFESGMMITLPPHSVNVIQDRGRRGVGEVLGQNAKNNPGMFDGSIHMDEIEKL